MDTPADVLVAGSGPAGWAVAAACAREGLATSLVAPDPDAPWPATYGGWLGEFPSWVPLLSTATGFAVCHERHDLGWTYAVLDNAALLAQCRENPVQVHADRIRTVVRAAPGVAARLAGGRELRAAVLIDATGSRPPARGLPAELTAVGVVVDAEAAARLVPPGTALVMDWRPSHGESGWPTFCYGVPLEPGRVLIEENVLARRPGLPYTTLQRRLRARLDHHGVGSGVSHERVRLMLDAPRQKLPGTSSPVVAFGAAAPLIHPATGYSVAAALQLAPRVAAALRAGLSTGPAAARAAHRAIWSPRARIVHLARRYGLAALLTLSDQRAVDFFDLFFHLPPALQWAYLTGREDVSGTLATMARLYARASSDIRRTLLLQSGGKFHPSEG